MPNRNFKAIRLYGLFIDITSAYISQSILVRFTSNLASSVKDLWHSLSGIVKMSHHTSDLTLPVIDMDSEGDVLLIVGKKGSKSLRVSSKVLCLASSVFKAKLLSTDLQVEKDMAQT